MENNLRQSFLNTKDPKEEKYLKFINLEFDYEINKVLKAIEIKEEKSFLLNQTDNLSETFSEKDSSLNCNQFLFNNKDKFDDQLATRYFRSEKVSFYKKNYLKAIISRKRIRLITNEFDLDLV